MGRSSYAIDHAKLNEDIHNEYINFLDVFTCLMNADLNLAFATTEVVVFSHYHLSCPSIIL